METLGFLVDPYPLEEMHSLLAILPILCSPQPVVDPDVRVLFLGDRGHHRPAERHAELSPALARRGIELTYTEDLSLLSAEGLEHYDVLCVYANIDLLPEENERALMDWVNDGGGLVALHCASFCFRNSEAWIELVGAQFQRHGAEVFRTTVVERDHPVTRGYLPFESWDETYVHTLHNEDRTVLEVREDGEGAEPYTWTRVHGRGRVFYTAWGHDGRTFQHEGFHELVDRGIRWAAGMNRPLEARISPESKPARIPNYLAGEDDARMVEPLNPEQSLAWSATAAGIDVRLFAAEPDVASPLALTWDDSGRLYLAESVDYPNERRPEGEGRDRIVMVEDLDQDGRGDRFSIFADNLSVPTSLLWVDGGLLVHQPPRTLFLKDHDGDGVADERRVVLDGWGAGDTHAGPSNLRYGIDNWIYGTVGYSGFRGTVGGEQLQFGSSLYRFRTDGSELEVLCSTSNNTWGLGLSETGEVFNSTANNDQICYLAIPNRFYEGVSGWHGNGWSFIGDYREFHPLTPGVRQVDWHDRYTAAAGSAIYTARAFPSSYWNSVALVCEPTGHLVHKSRLERDGAGFVARDGHNLFASGDEWCAPIVAEVGPDGAVWVIDWYSYVVQHNPTPRGFETGRGNAYVTPHRDKQYARILRLVHREAPPLAPRDLTEEDAADLVTILDDDNMFWRLHAQRLLVERDEGSAVPALESRLASPRLDEIGNDPGAIHAMWTLHGLDALSSSAVLAGLTHPSAAVRKNAARAAAGRPEVQEGLVALLDDSDALVVREALLALSSGPASEEVGARVYDLLGDEGFVSDRWLVDAATAAAAAHDAGFLGAALAKAPPAEEREAPRVPENLLPNPSFEDGAGDTPAHWRPRTYSGSGAQHTWVQEGRHGSRCVRIESGGPTDTSWYVDVPVDPRGRYRLSGWVRTEDVRGAMGGLFNVHTMGQTVTQAVGGTEDWQQVEVVFDAAGRDRVSLNCLFGGWGQSTGTVWYDDLSLIRVEDTVDLARLGAVRGGVVATVTRHYAGRGPVESIASLLARVEGADPGLAGFVLEGLAQGWPAARVPVFDSTGAELIRRLAGELPVIQAADLVTLAGRWSFGPWFAELRSSTASSLALVLEDREASTAERLAVAARLVALDSGVSARTALISALDPAEDPDLNQGLLDALATLTSDEVGSELLARWSDLTTEGRRTALALCLRRPAWSGALLDAVEAGAVNHANLTAQDWQRLEQSPDAALAARASEVAASGGRTTSPDRAAVYERLLPLASRPGDAERGRTVYRELCMVCHTYGGEGGEVGPSLEGVGARGRDEILLEIVDPNRSLESTYQAWVVRTNDGEILTGRMAAESRTTVELLDAEGRSIVVDRADIDAMAAQGISIMPVGLVDDRPAEDVRALLEYLSEEAGGR